MLQLNPLDRPSVHTILEKDIIKKNLGFVLNNSLRKFEESLPGLNNSKKLSRESSSHRKILQKKSLYSLSSSMLTNKNTNTTMKSGYDSMKMVEMKQSYPILQE